MYAQEVMYTPINPREKKQQKFHYQENLDLFLFPFLFSLPRLYIV